MNLLKRFFVSILALIIGVPLVIAPTQSMISSLMLRLQTLPLIETAVVLIVGVGVLLMLVEVVTSQTLGVSPIGVVVLIAAVLSTTKEPDSGRDQFVPTASDRLRRLVQRRGLAVDDVMRRSEDADAEGPVLKDGVSMAVTGQTRNGKSAFVKGKMTQWNRNRAIIAHAMAENEGENEIENHLRDNMNREIIRVSSRDSTHRWDPLLDASETTEDMNRISDMMFEAGDPPETGWSPTARSFLRAVIMISSVEFGDFSRVPDVLARNPDDTVDQLEAIPGTDMLRQSLAGSDDLDIAQRVLLNNLGTILDSEIFDSSLPALSLTDFYADPGNRAVLLNDYEGDDYADAFYRFFLESAISYALETSSYEYFVLDEVDKLPLIRNLTNLASAGAKVNCEAIIIFQNRTEMDDVYGPNKTDTIWSNAPNRVSFCCGDAETADLVLSSIGRQELESRSVAGRSHSITADQSVTKSRDDKLPVTQNSVMSLNQGEALISSPDGWWICDLTYSGY